MFYHRWYCHDIEALHLKVVTLCALFCLSSFGPCTMTGTHNPVGYDEYGSYRNDLNSGAEDVLIGDFRKRISPQSSIPDLFCFPSTLSGFFADFRSLEANASGFTEVKEDETVNLRSTEANNNLNWSSDSGNFRLLNGNVVSCSLELKKIDNNDQNDIPSCKRSLRDLKTYGVNQKEESVRIKSCPMDDFTSLYVQISHPLLDWGQKYLHFPSLASLTVENRHNHSVLSIFEPFSTDPQFYPCNYSQIKLEPGEVASICFVFLPKSLGFSSAHLILQTSLGGFLIQAQGFAVKSPYVIQSSIGLNYSSNGKWSNIVSVFNPSDKVLNLKEVTVWISFSSGSVSYSVKTICSRIDHKGSSEFSFKEWLDVKIGENGQPIMAIRPQKTWTIGSNSNEPILELKFPNRPQAKNIFATFCGRLLNGSRDNLDKIILEEEIGGKSGFYDLETLSISLGVLIPCDANGTVIVSLLLRNNGPGPLTVVKIRAVGEKSESLQIKYVEGIMLFPYSETQVGMVTYTPDSHVNLNCKLVVETNKSDGQKLEISCGDIASLCSRSHSYAGYGHQNGVLNYENSEKRSSNVHIQSPSEMKATEMAKADESVLGNWRSQGTKNGISVLNDNEIIFPLVHVGSRRSKWINILNPSDQPKFFLAILVSVLLISIASSCSFSFTIRHGNLSKSEQHSSDIYPKKPESEPEPESETGKEMTSSSSLLSKSMVVEASKPENLTVKTGKEKSRRRKKKRGSGSGLTGLTGQFEVLSSQSSNSTPSSPLSSGSSSTPKRSPELLSPNVRARNPFKNSVVLPPPQDINKPLAPVKTVGPRARAPGAERKVVKPEEGGSRSEDRFMYNIWDDHLRLRFLGSGSLEVCVMATIAEDNNFGSLFAVSPQELFTFVAKNVSFKQDD